MEILDHRQLHKFLLAMLLSVSLVSCGSQGFHLKQLAKSDIDMMSDTVFSATREELKTLLLKLYKRNPNCLAKVENMTAEKRLSMIFDRAGHLRFEELVYLEEIHAMSLAFSDEFSGDRVFALMVGLTGMFRQSYSYDNDFFMFDDLDAQALYNSARNIEVMAWKLKNKTNQQGRLLLITSTLNGVVDNTSFERIYGKLINTQDIMSQVIVDKDNRTLNTVIKGTLSVFLPI